MLTKFDSKSNRVKGLSFHPKRPWILSSLHNGVIQLWDYRMGTLLDSFVEHTGPVRGIDFHRLQPLFVSGGDDYKIKVWNYKLRRCLFTLQGHLDYIRTVEFHPEYPWIVSASDDQTIRLWNWQSRTCVSVLTGHNHYVMCAQFHPKEDLVVSASLDQTIRVWDTSGLRKKTVRGAPSSTTDEHGLASRVNSDLFGGNDAIVKYVLEGHDRGANWASFHHSLPLIVSGADDRQVKLWRMNETKAWEVDTMRGHTNNVSCVIFHPRHELVISNSEDRSIRIWDMAKRLGIQTFRREHDRFWILAAHPEQNLLAAGHDSGMLVFKLERERPAYGGNNGSLFYVKDRYLRRCVLGSGIDVPLLSLRRTGSTRNFGTQPRTLVINPYNPAEDNLLIHSLAEGGSYELYCLNQTQGDAAPVRGNGLAAVFLARQKFAVLDKSRTIIIKDLANAVKKRIKPPYANADYLFTASTSGRVLVRAEDKIALFETQSRRVLNEVAGYFVKYVVWSQDSNYVALLAKNAVVIADRNLQQVASVSETVAVKSGVWDENGVFIYTTLNHIKYLLPTATGDGGIVRTLEVPVYATECRGSTLHCLDRDGKTLSIMIDPTEFMFKLALANKQYDKVLAAIKGSRLCGQAVIAYLQKAGYPEVALHFVQDETTRFNLALECGNLDIARQAAQNVGKDECWHRLAVAALRQGNHEVVEMAYQQTKNYDRLSFLYLITGNTVKLKMMLKIAEVRNDVMSRFHNALYLGSVEDRIKILESAGQIPLAYLTAATYGLEEDAARFKEGLEAAELTVPDLLPSAQCLLPPVPIVREENWPLLTVSRGPFDGILGGGGGGSGVAGAAGDGEGAGAGGVGTSALHDVGDLDVGGGAWGDDDLDLGLDGGGGGAGEAGATETKGDDGDDAGGAWGDDLDLGLDGLDLPGETADLGAGGEGGGAAAGAGGSDGVFVAPTPGKGVGELWVSNSSCAADHAAAGSFETAMGLLHRQIGLANFAPLRQHFMSLYMGSHTAVPSLPSVPSLGVPVIRAPASGDAGPPGPATLPAVALTLSSLVERLKLVYRAFAGGKFSEANTHLDYLLSAIPLCVVNTRSEADEVKELLGIVTEYKTAVHVELTRKSIPAGTDNKRQLELAAYLTMTNVQPSHLLLCLNLAMSLAFKLKNFINAASFARRLLELGASAGNAQLLTKAKKVLQLSEAEGRNAISIDFDEMNPYKLCCASLTPIYRGSPVITSPYCHAAYKPEFKGSVCRIDGMSVVGVETVGLVSMPASSSRRG